MTHPSRHDQPGRDLARAAVLDQVLAADSFEAIVAARETVRRWLGAHPDDWNLEQQAGELFTKTEEALLAEAQPLATGTLAAGSPRQVPPNRSSASPVNR